MALNKYDNNKIKTLNSEKDVKKIEHEDNLEEKRPKRNIKLPKRFE